MSWRALGSGLVMSIVMATALNFDRLASERADYWRPIFDGIAGQSGDPPMGSMSVIPFKGCGWEFGETVKAETTIGGIPATLLMCRTTHGVRFDIITRESRWLRGGDA